LCGLSFKEVVDDPLVRVSLFDITIFEIDNCIAILESFSPDTVGKNDLFLTVEVSALNFTVSTLIFIFDGHIIIFFIMVLFWVIDVKLLRIYLLLLDVLHLLRFDLESTPVAALYFHILFISQMIISSSLALGWAFLPQLFLNPFKLHRVLISSATSNPAYLRIHSLRGATALLSTKGLKLV
jgi:hypothetical protein